VTLCEVLNLVFRGDPDVVAVIAHLVHRSEWHRRAPEPLLVERLCEFVCSLLVDSFDEDVDVFGRARSPSEDSDLPRDVDVLDVELSENFGESDRQLVELVRLAFDDECSIPEPNTAHRCSSAGDRINRRERWCPSQLIRLAQLTQGRRVRHRRSTG